MKKICVFLFFVLVYSFNVNAQYVRKRIKPDFFIPEYADFNKQEKIPVVNKKQVKIQPEKEEKSEKEENIYVNKPEFKTRFSEYSEDIKNIGKNENITNIDNIKKDIRDMNSSKLVKVNKIKPISKDEISREFDKILKEKLN